MLFKNINILDKYGEIKANQYVSIDGDVIRYIGDLRPEGVFDYEYDGKNQLLLPGFYNAHAHSPMTLMRGYGENLSLQDWLNTRIFPFEAKLYGEAVYYGSLLSFAESIRYGIVSSTDMYDFGENIIKAATDSKVKINLGRALVAFEESKLEENKGFKEAKYLFENYNNADDGRVKVEMSLHAEYTSNEKLVRELADYTREINGGMHLHISETQREHNECKERHSGKTPVEYFSDLGLFDTRTTAAHCVWIEEKDADILAEKGVTVASCPVSNLKLASGVCNVPLLQKKGVRVAIGTDSVASNNSLNFIEEMKFFALLNKERQQNPTLVTPLETVDAATFAGAQSQGRLDCGRIAEGYKADLIVVDMAGPWWHPEHDLLNNLVYSSSGSDVVLTMVDGEVIYKDGEYETIDIERVIFEVNKAKTKILGEL
jgi:5-methylthioadenosine/S-adenosylhomocysteine deaminase